MDSTQLFDRWLALLTLVFVLVLFIVPKTPAIIIFISLIIFVLLLYLLWGHPWVKKKRQRRTGACLVCALVVVWLGYISWPPQPPVMYFPNMLWIPMTVPPHQGMNVIFVDPRITDGYLELPNESDQALPYPRQISLM
jgi:hypothetical protein